MRRLTTTLLIIAFTITSIAQKKRVFESSISENALRAHIKFLSDDRLEGRGTGARGGELAALYIAQEFEALGLKGAGPKGSFWQQVSLVGVKADPKTELRIKGAEKAEAFKFAEDFVAFTGAQTEHVSLNSDLVFVGYGIEAPEQKWNDYKGPAEDYRGKILVMLVNDPPATTEEPDLFGGRRLTYYGRWTYKYEEAARRGAAGVILLHTNESAGYPWSVVRTSNGSWLLSVIQVTKNGARRPGRSSSSRAATTSSCAPHLELHADLGKSALPSIRSKRPSSAKLLRLAKPGSPP